MRTIEVPVSDGTLKAYANGNASPGIWVVFVDKDGCEYDIAVVESDGDNYDPDMIRTYVYGTEEEDDPTHIAYVSKKRLSAVATPSSAARSNVETAVDTHKIIKVREKQKD